MVIRTRKISIAGLIIEICNYTETSEFLPSLDSFLVNSDCCDIKLEIHMSPVIENENGDDAYEFRYSSGLVKCYLKNNEQVFDIYSGTNIVGKISKKDNSNYFLLLNTPNNLSIVNFTLMFIFCSVSVYKRLLIHSSVVVLQDEAYLFYGKSGSGKSTQALHWIKSFNNCWHLNDDNPIIEISNGIPYVWGSPWSGKSPIFINKRYPIKGLVSVGKNKSFKVKKFDKNSFISDFLQSCCYNPIDNNSILKIFDICYDLWLNIKPISFHCPNKVDSANYLYYSLNSLFLKSNIMIQLTDYAIKHDLIIKIRIEGNSMYPTLKSGISLVYIKPYEEYSIGDIIMVKHGDKLIIHRLITINENLLTTKGDGNNFSEVIPKSSYIGKVIKIKEDQL